MATELHPLLQEYYEETDPDKRRKCLEKYESDPAAASDPACQYRRDLYEARFTDPKKPGRIVDRFLWNLMSFSVIQKTPGLFPKHHKKEVLSAMRNMQLNERPLNEPVCEDALYRELRNAVRRFFSTCSDSSYAGGFFGLIPAKPEKRNAQCCIDIWSFSCGISRLLGLEQEMALLCRAANDEYCALVPGTVSLEEAYKINNK